MPQAPEPIQPMPMPSQWMFDHTHDGKFIVMGANTPAGTTYYFLQPQSIAGMIAALKDQKARCAQASAGISDSAIVVPPTPIFGPDGNPVSMVPPSTEVQEHVAQQQGLAADGDDG